MKKLLTSLEEKYDTVCTLIQERHDFKELTPSQALGRLTTHEIIMEEMKELHSSRSISRRGHALKAKVDSSSEELEESSDEVVDKESIGKNLALLVKKFNIFQKGIRFKKCDSNKGSNSSSDLKKRICFNCKEPRHYIANCPLLKEECKKEQRSRKDKDDEKDKSDKKPKKEKHHKKECHSKSKTYKKGKYKAHVYLGKEMDSEVE